ncbi:MAG: Hint domain-containing protein, partial [Candidatus Parabeggiatoa sp.]|nr:Hint domain-containing protein [Candidatus Parabeggiatoa sp.]
SISIRGILTGMARFDQLMGVIDFVNDPTAFFYDRLMNRTLRILNRLRFLKWLRLYNKKKKAKKDASKKNKDEDCPVTGNSFTAETLVHTQRGLITIAEVQIGDQVWSYNEETGEQQWNEVVHLIQGEQEYDLVVLTLENDEIIEATNEHPFYVVEKGWVGAENLTQGDVLLLKEGNIKVVALVREQRKTVVYNLTVANAHNYFVGSDGVLVHNASKKGKRADKGPMDVCIRLDGTGKVHGELEYFPKPKDFDRYSREELEDLLDELRKSIETRIEVTVDKGRERNHGQRQGNEQKLIKQLEKYLSK